jgi:hypothetical protein
MTSNNIETQLILSKLDELIDKIGKTKIASKNWVSELKELEDLKQRITSPILLDFGYGNDKTENLLKLKTAFESKAIDLNVNNLQGIKLDRLNGLTDYLDGQVNRFRNDYHRAMLISVIIFGVSLYIVGWRLDMSQDIRTKVIYISVLVFINLTLFVFFRQASRSMGYVKFLHNERIAIEFKMISLQIAIASENLNIIEKTVDVFSKTEKPLISNDKDSDINDTLSIIERAKKILN